MYHKCKSIMYIWNDHISSNLTTRLKHFTASFSFDFTFYEEPKTQLENRTSHAKIFCPHWLACRIVHPFMGTACWARTNNSCCIGEKLCSIMMIYDTSLSLLTVSQRTNYPMTLLCYHQLSSKKWNVCIILFPWFLFFPITITVLWPK